MEKKMAKVGLEMNLLMGITMSFFLSLVGILSSGHFSVPGWLTSFLISVVAAFVIGFIFPVQKISAAAVRKSGLNPNAMGGRCLEALVSNLIYTPLMTLIMVFLAWKGATAAGAQIPFAPMYFRSLLFTFPVGFVLVLIIARPYLTFVLKRNGIPAGGPRGGRGKR